DLTSDNHLEMVLGNKRGGLALYKSAPISDIGFEENALGELLIYPNPTTNELTIDLGAMSFDELQRTELRFYDLTGRLITQMSAPSSKFQINTAGMARGTYVVEIVNGTNISTQKVLLQ